MAALTRPWIREQVGDLPTRRSNGPMPVKAGVKLWPGALLSIETNAGGWLKPAISGANTRVVGVCPSALFGDAIDNTNGGNGAISTEALRGCWPFHNSSANPVTAVHVGGPCYVQDDNTVSSDNTATLAGTVRCIRPDGLIEVEIQ